MYKDGSIKYYIAQNLKIFKMKESENIQEFSQVEENAKLKRELPKGNYAYFPEQGIFTF